MKRGPDVYLENSDEWDGHGFPEEYEIPGTEEAELTTAGIVAIKGRCKARDFQFPVCNECGKRHYKKAGKKCEYEGGE